MEAKIYYAYSPVDIGVDWCCTDDLAVIVDNMEEGEIMMVKTVKMTEEEYNALSEHDGF